jgi:beta-glucosidase
MYKTILSIISVTAFLLCGLYFQVYANNNQLINEENEKKIESLLSKMTLEEKIGQIVQFAAKDYSGKSKNELKEEQIILAKEGKIGSFLNFADPILANRLQEMVVKESRLGIPLIIGHDVIHGLRTVFPIPLAEASSWDAVITERAARISAIEATAAGIRWTFAPMVDIARDPRWGRIAEGSGEDPYLGSIMAVARVRGFQGSDLSDPTSVVACAKHFAAYGGAIGGRDYNTVEIPEHILREIYLPPFKAALDAGVGTFMTSFNDLNGIPSTANHFLLTKVLRDEWGFKGFVVSDWESVKELLLHGIAGTPEDAATLALTAGCDMDMEGGIYTSTLQRLVKQGKISNDTLNEAVRRVLRIKMRLGLFDNPFVNPERFQKDIFTQEHLDAALESARKSIVLLKNDNNILPLNKRLKKLAVIGPLADNRKDPIGPWASEGRPEDTIPVLQAIKEKLANSGTKILYAEGCKIKGGSKDGIAKAVRIAKQAGLALLVVGESADMSGEAASRTTLDIPGHQLELIEAVYKTGVPVIVVLMNGRPLLLENVVNNSSAIVETWFLGTRAGHAIADVLFGDYNPGGKLPVSFPRNIGQIPIYYNYKNTGRPVGVSRYTSRYLDSPNTPLFPFGYGLSYTTFKYGDLQLSNSKIRLGEDIRVSVEVENTGRVSGEEVVQLYIRDLVSSMTRPVKELKGFERIGLNPGQKKRVEFTLKPEHLGFHNKNMEFKVEPGRFKVWVGTNSIEGIEGEFEVVEP